jgi:predicted MFS family arabinose efflux permease
LILRRTPALSQTRATLTTLTIIHATLVVAVLLFAQTTVFAAAAICLTLARVLRRVDTPLLQAYVNENAEPEVRATVLSFQSQAHGLGEIGGGPIAATIAGLYGTIAALTTSGVLVIPTALTFLRARKFLTARE